MGINTQTYKSFGSKRPVGKTKLYQEKISGKISVMKFFSCYCKGGESHSRTTSLDLHNKRYFFHRAVGQGQDTCQSCNTASSCILLLSSSPTWFFPGRSAAYWPLVLPVLTLTFVLGLKELGNGGVLVSPFSLREWEKTCSSANGSLHSEQTETGCILALKLHGRI